MIRVSMGSGAGGLALGLILAAVTASPALAQTTSAAPPAGGAALGQVIGVSVAAMLLTGALLAVGLGHRCGRVRFLGRWARRLSVTPWLRGLPGWAALPLVLATMALVTAVLGMYWDISLHIDNGRDPGPLANPAHYFILAGLFGLFSAGWLALVLPDGRPGRAAVRLTRDWHVPVSGILLMACGSFALIGFPLDDVWHRLFGQDVTLWGPTHLMLIGGAGLAMIGVMGLIVEGRASMVSASGEHRGLADDDPEQAPSPAQRLASVGQRLQVVLACGGLLVGLSVFQGEFDSGVEQFRLLFEPALIAVAASTAMVVARIVGGRGTALGAAIFFIVLRGGLALLVGGLLGQTVPHLPLYLVEALAVEGVALTLSPRRPYRFGIAAGLAVGSLGTLGEWAWSQVGLPLPWPAHMLAPAVGASLPIAVAGGVLGAFVGTALRLRSDHAATPRAWMAAGASLAVIAATVGLLLNTTVPARAHATVTLADVRSGPHREVQATVSFVPPAIARHADWLTALAWQGRGRLVLRPLRRISDGVYRSTEPVPVFGRWKTMIRLQTGQTMASVPVYLPADAAIPVPGVSASQRFTRGFTADRTLLQRERKRGVPPWVWMTASMVVLGLFVILLALIGWGLARLAARCDPNSTPRALRAPRPVRGRPANATAPVR